jgi:phytoene dehydrogenase-like protein
MSAAPATRHDCIVIGGGHNGLVCAALLARAGRSVLVLEANPRLGGAAATREFAPGFQVSAGAHLLHALPALLVSELKLESHGLRWAGSALPTSALLAGAPPLAVGEMNGPDAAAYGVYAARMRRFAAALAPVLTAAAPRLGTKDWSDRLALLRLGWQIRKLGRADMRELLRIGGMNVYDLLEEHFQSAALKGALAFDAVLGTNFGPRSPGSVLTLLHRLAGESGAGAAGLASPKGGMGALADALANAARAAGAAIRLDARVVRILVDNDRACGVELVSGEKLAANAVVSNADPKTTLLQLLGARHLDAGFVRRLSHFRSRGLTAKLHLALADVPRFAGVSPARLAGRLLIAPSMQYIEAAYNHSKYGEFSAQPILEIHVPTLSDPALAPAGKHVLSAIVQYAPYDLKGGWDAARPRFIELLTAALARHAPGLDKQILSAELLAPPDLEREFHMSGGHWHHGELAFDQFLMVRPVPGAAQHRTPLERLYLCGAGCHPGGGVMGTAGRNAARQILKQAA